MKNLNLFSLLIISNLLFSTAVQSQSWFGSGMKGEGQKVSKTIDLSSFDAIGLSINADVYLSQGSTQSVKIEAQKNILDNIVKSVSDGYWKIKFDKDVRSHDGVKIWITIPDLTKIAVSGSGNVEGKTVFNNLDYLKLAISGSGNIELESNSRSLRAAVSGSGDYELSGKTGDAEFRIAGSGDIEAENLIAENCNVKISGSGDASVHVNGDLNVGIAGSGDVFYRGSPNVKSKISGSGDVQAK